MSNCASGPGGRRRGALLNLICLAAALVMLATTTAPASASTSTAPPIVGAPANQPPVPVLAWTDCGDGFDCATARVPLDYDEPHGPTITLRLNRLPATDPAHHIGSIFLNPGGPGGSGVDFAREFAPLLFSAEVRARFDLVGFDPRGILRSTAMRCFGSRDQAENALAPMAFPFTHPDERVWEHSDAVIAKACATKAGPIINHMSTANVARDLDLLRQAVGDAQLNYYGISYGSYIGETYANLFPGKVRSVIIDGVIDPVGWSTGHGDDARTLPAFSRLRNDQSAYETLQQFFVLCDQGGKNCPFSGHSEARYQKLANELKAHPLAGPDGSAFRYSDLVSASLDALYWPPAWPYMAKALAKLERAIGSNVPATTAAAVLDLRNASKNGAHYRNFVEGQPGVVCTDTANPSSTDAFTIAGRDADRQFGYFGRLWTWLTSICTQWPGHDADRYMGPFNTPTANPLLLIGNHYDPATPYSGAVKAANLMPGSRLLTLDGWGHTALLLSQCINNYESNYLLTKTLPSAGQVCQPDGIPFQ